MAEARVKSSSWWQTIPGILTGIAALITAVTGLIVAFNRAGDGDDRRPSAPSELSVTPPAPTSSSPGAASSGATPQAVVLPPLTRVKLAQGDADITILSARIEPLDLDRRTLTIGLRYLNAGRYPANFWTRSFRLVVGEVPRAPTNSLNEVVEGESAKEGEVVFEVPAGVKDVVLQISAGDDKSSLPLKLP